MLSAASLTTMSIYKSAPDADGAVLCAGVKLCHGASITTGQRILTI